MTQEGPTSTPLKLAMLALAGLAALMCAAIFWSILQEEIRVTERRFLRLAEGLETDLRKNIADSEAVLSGFSAFLEAVNTSDAAATRRYAQVAMDAYPQIYALEVARRVDAAQAPKFEASMRRFFRPDFSLHPFGAPAGQRVAASITGAETWPIVFRHPIPADPAAIHGLQLESVGNMGRSVALARQQNRTVASEPFELLQGGKAFILMRQVSRSPTNTPVSAADFFGDTMIALALVKTDKLLPADTDPALQLSVYRANPDATERIALLRLGDLNPATTRPGLLPVLTHSTDISTASMPLHLEFRRQTAWSELLSRQLVIAFLVLSGIFALLSLVLHRLHTTINASRRHQARFIESESRFRTLFEDSPAMMLVIDPDTRALLDANRAASRFFGLDHNPACRRTLPHALLPDPATPAADGSQTIEHSLAPGDTRQIEVRQSTILVDRRAQTFVIATDITEREQARHALIAARDSADAANRSKTKFLGATSHDLRHPLFAIDLLLGSLEQTALSPEQLAFLQRLKYSAATMGQMLSNLIRLAGLEAPQHEPRTSATTVTALFLWIDEEFSLLMQKSGLRFKLYFPTSEICFSTDVDTLKNILRNLINNALKYTPQGGVMVSARRRGERLLLQVWDTGVGISDQDLAHIFDEYYQVGNPERNWEKGFGLGLAIAAREARLIGGTLTCHSRLGRGSVFNLDLPPGLDGDTISP